MLPPDPTKKLTHKAVSDSSAHSTALTQDDPGALALVAAPPPAVSAPPSLGALLQAFRRCWRLAVFVALVGALGAIAVAWFVVPGQYVGTAVFRIPPAPDGTSPLDHQKSYAAFIKSASILEKVLFEPGVADVCAHRYTPTQLDKAMLVDFSQGTCLMRVALSADHAEDAALLLNALGKVYPRELQAQKMAQDAPALQDFKEQRASAQKALDEKRSEYETPRIKAKLAAREDRNHTVASAEGKLLGEESKLAGKRAELSDFQLQLQAKREQVEAPILASIEADEIEAELRKSKRFEEQQDRLRNAERGVAFYREKTVGSARDNGMAAQQREIEAAQAELGKLRAVARVSVEKRLKELAKSDAQKAVKELSVRVQQATAGVKHSEVAVRDARIARDVAKATTPRADPDLDALEDDLERLKARRNSWDREIDRKEQALRVSESPMLFEVPVPQERKLDRKFKVSAAAGLSVFGLLLLGVCLLESRSRRVYATADISQGLGLPVVGTIPALPLAARRAPIAPDAAALAVSPGALQALSTMTESIDALRTVLLHAPQVDGSRVVMITSAVGGEGKTTLASHLAASLARAWRKTLLIDGDLRNPAAHVVFDLPLGPGFCEGLRGEVELDDAIRPTAVSRLWLLPAGQVDSHALQALAQEGVGGIFERLKEQFDFIVIDTSPILPVPDGLLLAGYADTVLLSVLRDVSRVPAVYAAQQRLQALGIRTSGAVVIGEKVETYGRSIPYPRSNVS